MESDKAFKYSYIRSSNGVYWARDLIGTGRFSRVYQATDMSTKETVVIKALCNRETFSQPLYMRELDLLNELKSSPLRVRYVDLRDAFQLKCGTICFVMERLGITLQAVLHNIGALPMSMCRPIVRQIAQGLSGLKIMGIVHADLKPDNIMFCAGIGNNHLVKIIDFGWAFRAEQAGAMHNRKMQAVPYRAPEVSSRGALGHGLDVWSLGVIMPEIVTGVRLFGVTDEQRLVGLVARALADHAPGPSASTCPRTPDDDGQTKLSDGWIRFREFCKNAETSDSDGQKKQDVEWFADLVYKMLTLLPQERITAVDALSHPFLTMVHFINYPSTSMTKKNVNSMGKCCLDI